MGGGDVGEVCEEFWKDCGRPSPIEFGGRGGRDAEGVEGSSNSSGSSSLGRSASCVYESSSLDLGVGE